MRTPLDLTNQKFGRLTAIEVTYTGKVRGWKCKCDCGNEVVVSTSQLNNGIKQSCGCLVRDRLARFSLLGKRFGKLIVVEFAGYGICSRPQWKCKCDCGNEIIAYSKNLNREATIDCGCGSFERKSKANRKEYGKSTRNRIIESYKRNAKKKGLDFSLGQEKIEALFQGNCHYCGCGPNNMVDIPKLYGTYTYNGIDRLDPKLGYVETNVVSCCQVCNYLKNSYTEQEFLDVIKKIAQHRNLV